MTVAIQCEDKSMILVMTVMTPTYVLMYNRTA